MPGGEGGREFIVYRITREDTDDASLLSVRQLQDLGHQTPVHQVRICGLLFPLSSGANTSIMMMMMGTCMHPISIPIRPRPLVQSEHSSIYITCAIPSPPLFNPMLPFSSSPYGPTAGGKPRRETRDPQSSPSPKESTHGGKKKKTETGYRKLLSCAENGGRHKRMNERPRRHSFMGKEYISDADEKIFWVTAVRPMGIWVGCQSRSPSLLNMERR